jgi:hypothetical protein
MSTAIFVLILIAAACHATWNAIVKAGTNKFLTTVLVTASAAVLAALLLPFFPMPHSDSWPYILTSTEYKFSILAWLPESIALPTWD